MDAFFAKRRKYGTLAVVHEVAYKLAQRVMTLDVTHLMRLSSERVSLPDDDPGEFTFQFLTAEDVRRFSGANNGLSAELAGRIELGRDFCFAALSKDRLAAYAWYALGSIEAEHNRGGKSASGVAMSFPDDMAFMYKGFTHPDFRGRSLYGFVNARALEALRPRGVTTVISTADWTNWSALNSCWRLGYEDLGLVWRGGWEKWMFTGAPRQGKTLGIEFGRDARVHSRESGVEG